MVHLQLHYATYPDLKPPVLPRCPLPLYHPLLPPHPNPFTTRDPLLPQYPVLSNYFRRVPLWHYKTIQVTFRLFQAFMGAKANPEGVRQVPTLKRWQTFRLSAGFRCVFPFVQVHCHAFLQMSQQQYTQGYPARQTEGLAASKDV